MNLFHHVMEWSRIVVIPEGFIRLNYESVEKINNFNMFSREVQKKMLISVYPVMSQSFSFNILLHSSKAPDN